MANTTSFEIHPAIGIARVGNSTAFFDGPGPGVAPPGKYRDRRGRLLRQAARFRVFRCTRAPDGTLRAATEVTGDQAEIEWTVHVANRKGASPEFPPSPAKTLREGGRLRNADHADRAELVIDPGPRSLRGTGGSAAFDTGSFLGTSVPLGEMRADADGSLLVLGGVGTSGTSPRGVPAPITHFANNDNWYDDVSDGPVTAIVRTAGARRAARAKPAWVVTAPPDYAPGITNFVTLYDVAYQAAVERGWRQVPPQPSFTRHVQPILQRAVGYQWVLELGRRGHGPFSGFGDFSSRWTSLADPSPNASFGRELVLGMLKDPSVPPDPIDPEFGMMPRLHHNDYGTPARHVLRPTAAQYAILQRWAAGHFVNDLDSPPADGELLPDALDRMSLEACSGGPFFPGIEVGGLMAEAARYSEAFRVDAASHQPGDLTAGNAVPWQADFLACSVDTRDQLGWWPAQRPYQVFPTVDSEVSEFWHRGVTGYRGMVNQWHALGVVVEARRRDGTTVFVESERRPLPS
ncbi:MAG TPA: LodA/GoxA family CTQ-dependent oxidase [Acidimicrobiales bacterium]|nr:LodA/GoxA family CTQ-dependent oxidase [Acidimicrobiales bacterium]